MKRMAGILAILIPMASAPLAGAQSTPEDILLTSGVVKLVDLRANTIVLETGRKLRPRAILLNDEWVDISAVHPEDSIVLSGVDLGQEDVRASAVERTR